MLKLIIISLEILVILQETLTRYATNHHPREYTQAAYYLPFDNEEYSWTRSNRIGTHKKHRRRKKYNDDSISAETDYGPKRLKCKCTCKRKYDTKSILDYVENDPCCNCDSKSDAGNSNHVPTQYPNEENNGIYRPTQYPNVENNGLYKPIQYPNEENNGIYRPNQYPNGENNGIYMPTQYPNGENNRIYRPTQYPNKENNGIYMPTQYPNGENNGIYMPTQYPNEENNEIYGPIQYPNEDINGIYRSTQYPNGENNGIYMPTQFSSASYPSMIFPTFDRSLIDKIFPWLTQETMQTTKTYNDGQIDKDTATKDERDKYSTTVDKNKSSTSDDKDIPSTRDDRDKTSTSDGKDRSSTKDDRDKPSTSNDKDRSSTTDDRDKASTREDRDKISRKDDKDRPSTKDDRDKPSTKDSGDKPSTKDDKYNPLTRDDSNGTSSKRDKNDGIMKLSYEIINKEEERHFTFEPTVSTYPYVVASGHLKKLFNYLPKKKKCLRDNNNCVRKQYTNRKVGRYYKDDLVERPTIASYLNVKRRSNNVPRKLYEDKPHYGIIAIPANKRAVK